MKITKRQLRRIIKENLDDTFAQWGPTTDHIEAWWENMGSGAQDKIVRQMKMSQSDLSMWNARDWEKAQDYYVQIVQGDPRGHQRGRNI